MSGTRLSFAASVVVASSLMAQTSTQVPAPRAESLDQAAAKIEVTTRLVTLNVLVHDRRRHPVGGLSKSDFEVADAGRAQAISVFSVNHLLPPDTQPAASLPRNIVANRPTLPAGVAADVTVILVDSYNTSATEQAQAKSQLHKSLKGLPMNQIAIYTLNSRGFAIAHDFTNNAESLRAAAAKAAPQSGSAVLDRADSETDRIDAMLDESKSITTSFLTNDRISNTSLALRSVADHLSGIAGRKNLIWITGEVPPELVKSMEATSGGNNQHLTPDVAAAAQALNNANIAVYPVDPRSTKSPCQYEPSQQPDPRKLPKAETSAATSNMPTLPTLEPCAGDANGATMARLADLTGGKAFHDVSQAVRHAMDDSTVTYTLGYYVAASDWKNGYHKLKVTLRRSGLNVRTKKGYLTEDTPPLNSVQLDAALNDAVWSPLDSTKLSVTARIDPSRDLSNASRLLFALQPAELSLRQGGAVYRGEFEVLFIQEQQGGQHGAQFVKTFRMALTPERYKALLTSGLMRTEDLGMQPNTIAIRIIVIDKYSGAKGSVTLAVRPEDKSDRNINNPKPTPKPPPTM